MNYKIILILTCLTAFAFNQTTKKIKSNKPLIVKTENKHAFTKDWDKKNKNIKNPELLKLIEILKQEFLQEREILKKEFNKKVKNLKKEYTQKRKSATNKYRKEKK